MIFLEIYSFKLCKKCVSFLLIFDMLIISLFYVINFLFIFYIGIVFNL